MTEHAAIRDNEKQQALVDRVEELRAQMDEKLDADPGLRQKLEALNQPVYDDPEFIRLDARFKRATLENHPETARGLIHELNAIADSYPSRQEAYKLVPEFKEMKDIEKFIAARPHPVQECLNFREDYFECLHGRKFIARMNEINRVASLKAAGKWVPPEDAGAH